MLLEPVNVLPHAHTIWIHVHNHKERSSDKICRQRKEVRYLIDVTTVDVSFKKYRADASKVPGLWSCGGESGGEKEQRISVKS